MLKKLSNAEKANFYRAVADLESNYGTHRVAMALEVLCENLDGRKQQLKHEQLELMAFEPEPTKPAGSRKYKGSKPRGANEQIIRRYFEINKDRYNGVDTPAELIVKLYYVNGMNQYQIAAAVGVNQRAISGILRSISEQRKRVLIDRWKEGKNIGY